MHPSRRTCCCTQLARRSGPLHAYVVAAHPPSATAAATITVASAAAATTAAAAAPAQERGPREPCAAAAAWGASAGCAWAVGGHKLQRIPMGPFTVLQAVCTEQCFVKVQRNREPTPVLLQLHGDVRHKAAGCSSSVSRPAAKSNKTQQQ